MSEPASVTPARLANLGELVGDIGACIAELRALRDAAYRLAVRCAGGDVQNALAYGYGNEGTTEEFNADVDAVLAHFHLTREDVN